MLAEVTSDANHNGTPASDTHLDYLECLIDRLEERSASHAKACDLSTDRRQRDENYWKCVSPQLPYIDGSSLSSMGQVWSRSGSGSLLEDTGYNTTFQLLSSNGGKGYSPGPKSQHSSAQSLTLTDRLSSNDECSNQRQESSPRNTLVGLSSNAEKTKFQKRLSFGDTLTLTTTIYTPVDEVDRSSGNYARTLLSKQHADTGKCDECMLTRKDSTTTHCQYLYMDKDFRYYFQHPWLRLIIAYLVIFCNFLLFAEDPISHSHTESNIPVIGNVFSFVATKYPTEWQWKTVKIIMWLIAIWCGMLVGKIIFHGYLFKQVLRLKMFRDDQGSWMTMALTVILSLYVFSYVYNLFLLIGHSDFYQWQIGPDMDVTNENIMKVAATCTWLGDLVTALMVTDMMLQDNLYPHWAKGFRRLYRLSNVPRILIFWFGSIIVAIVVIFLIVSDYISWDQLNKGFVETTELSRAFLASFILVMDLLIVMQDWDFPHFTNTIDVNLPGFWTPTLHWRYAEINVQGKWFNYGIIFMVMIFDLNMWKNQIFYYPEYYGQYINPVDRMVYTVENESVLLIGNSSLWTWIARSEIDFRTGEAFTANDMVMFSRYMGYHTMLKCAAFVPNILGFAMLFTLVTLYGRFPPNEDGTYGGRLKKMSRSSWRRERQPVLNYHSTTSSRPGRSAKRSNSCTNL